MSYCLLLCHGTISCVMAACCRWIFGPAMCKLFYACTSMSWFNSVFTLTVLSADRYVAICHPISALTLRSRPIAACVITCVWLTSALLALPIVLHAEVAASSDNMTSSCYLKWPSSAYFGLTLYTLVFCYVIPVSFISVFYAQVKVTSQ